MKGNQTVSEKQIVVFNMGEESYGVDIAMVREIIQLQPVTRVPGTPPSVEGMINLRGSVIPIVDLRKRFKLESIPHSKNTRIVVVSCKGQDVGVVVDAVAEVLRVATESIEPPSNLFTGENLEHMQGIVKLTNRLVILLNMDQVLSRNELTSLNAVNNQNNPSEKQAVTL